MYMICPICGNDINVNPRYKNGRCQYCRSYYTLERVGNKKKRFTIKEVEKGGNNGKTNIRKV